IRDFHVTGVQTCALPIYHHHHQATESNSCTGFLNRPSIPSTPRGPQSSPIIRARITSNANPRQKSRRTLFFSSLKDQFLRPSRQDRKSVVEGTGFDRGDR